MRKLDKEIADLRDKVAELKGKLARREGDLGRSRRLVRELLGEIERLEVERNFFKDQNDENLAENRELWRRLRRNPYSDDLYNEQ
jgi:septal ring factor EnvC (AmiA/AmiB activator)